MMFEREKKRLEKWVLKVKKKKEKDLHPNFSKSSKPLTKNDFKQITCRLISIYKKN